MADPTIAHPGVTLAKTEEYAMLGKVWQMGAGQRTRAIDTATRLRHEVLISRQCANGKTYNSTSFATRQQFDQFMRRLAAVQPREQKMFELWVRGQTKWHPTFDIDCAVPGVTEEEVLHVTVPGLQAFFLEEYGVVITTEDIVLLRSARRGGNQKVSFHMMIMNFYLEDYADFGRRVARYATRGNAAAVESPELRLPGFRWVDLCIWDATRCFRTARQHKHGMNNPLEPRHTCAGMQFYDSVGLAPHQHLSSFIDLEEGMQLLDESFTPPPPPRSRRGKPRQRAARRPRAEDAEPEEEDAGGAEEPEPEVVEAAKAAVAALEGHAACTYRGCYDTGVLYFMTNGHRVCACTGETHALNSFTVRHNEETDELEYQCFGKECKGQRRVIGRVPVPEGGHWKRRADQFLKAVLDAVTGLPSMPATGVADDVSEVLRAPPGTGKTKSVTAKVRSLLAANPGASVLVVTPLQELTRDTYKAYEDMGFRHYKDQAIRSEGCIDTNRLVCCVNSLAKVAMDCFDFVVVDEPNKILQDLPGTRGAVAIYEKLAGFMRQAQKCWVLDGYADSIVEKLMEHAGLGDTAVWTQVVHQNHPGRKATLLFGANLRVAVDKIVAEVLSGKRVAVPAATKINARTVCTALKERLMEHGKNVWLLTGETKQDSVDFMLAQLRDGRAVPPDVFIYTSKIEVGCSFELPLFHKAVALVSDNLSAESVMQMIERFRNLIDNEVLLWFDKNITDPDEVRACHDTIIPSVRFGRSP